MQLLPKMRQAIIRKSQKVRFWGKQALLVYKKGIKKYKGAYYVRNDEGRDLKGNRCEPEAA